MTITDQLSQAFATHLDTALLLSETVDAGIRSEKVGKFDNRVVVIGDSAQLRHTSVPGLYDVTGRVLVQQSIDTANAVASFQALCEEVRAVVNDKTGLPTAIESVDSDLRVHSYLLLGQEATQYERGLQAVFNWSIFAELPH